MRNGITVLLNLENLEPLETNNVTFINNGVTISYTNQYGIKFLETNKLVFTEDELTNSLTKQSFNFIDVKYLAIKALSVSNFSDIPALLLCFDKMMVSSQGIMSSSMLVIASRLNTSQQEHSFLYNLPSNNKEFYDYLYSKLIPKNFEKQKIYWLNFLADRAMEDQQEDDETGRFFPLFYY
ncbi:MAG: hypothetical protein ACRCTJ_00050 [Brevinema sp.]